MGFWSNIFRRSRLSPGINYQIGANAGFFDRPTRSGVQVTEATALGLSAVWCAVRTISQDVGTLSPILYRATDRTTDARKGHPVARLLRDSPNPEMTRLTFFETVQSHVLLHGLSVCEIQRDGAGRPIALWPIHPLNVQVFRDQSTGALTYRVTFTPSTADAAHPVGTQVDLAAEDVLAVPGLSPEGTVGYKLLTLARESIGFGIATQRYGAAFFGNSARPSGVLQTDGVLSDPARENLRKSFNEFYAGVDNVGLVAVLEEGLKFTPWTLTNEQSQLKDVLNWYVYEIARLFNIPPSKLWSLEKATWGNLETLQRDYLTSCLRPWLEKWEAELERKLLTPAERDAGLYIEFDTSALLRADQATRYTAYATALAGKPFLTVNEVRAMENRPAIDGGDVLADPPAQAPSQADDAQADPQPYTADTNTQEDDAKGGNGN